MKPIAHVAMLAALLAACAPAASHVDIPEKVLAALPPGTDPDDVGRRKDGCYYIQTEDELSGYLTILRDNNGELICDEI